MVNKVCLIYPRLGYKSGDPPLGLCYIASHLRNKLNIEVSILDATFHPSWNYISNSLRNKKPDLVGIYFNTLICEDAKKVAKLAKQAGAIVVGGGPHVSICPESVIKYIDIAVIGEGEKVMEELVNVLPAGDLSQVEGIWYKKSNNIYKNPCRKPINNLDNLEFPSLELIEMEKYYNYWHYLDSVSPDLEGINMIASRGCYYNCSFCQPTLRRIFGERVRYKSPQYLVEQIKYYIRQFGVYNFFFHDDTFTKDKNWAYDFFDVLQNKNMDILWGCNCRIDSVDKKLMQRMYEVGARCLHFGIESGSQRILDDIYHKEIDLNKVGKVLRTAKKIGLHIGGFFMLGAPGESWKEIEKTINLALNSSLDEVSFSIVTPLPGTDLYKVMKKDKKYNVSENYRDFDYYKKLSYNGGRCSYKQLNFLQKKALFLFYLHPARWRYVLHHLTSFKGIKKLYAKISRFF